MIGAPQLARMKPGALIVNCAVAGSRRESAGEALLGGRIGGAALDVFEEEPPPRPSSSSAELHRTPHLADPPRTPSRTSPPSYATRWSSTHTGTSGTRSTSLAFPRGAGAAGAFLRLCEKIGSFAGQLSLERPGGGGDVYAGEVAGADQLLTAAILKGVLGNFLASRQRGLGARARRERGTCHAEVKTSDTPDFASLVTLRLRSAPRRPRCRHHRRQAERASCG